MNLLLVTVDTLRADRLGCYGYEGAETEAIDRFATRGILFEDASTTATTTLPAHVSLLSGKWVHETGVDSNNDTVPTSLTLLPDVLAAAGYATAAFVSGRPLARHTGLASHFGAYDDTFPDALGGTRFPSERRAAHTVAAATDWLANAREPFFLWVHLYDPHAPRTPARTAADPYDGEVRDADAAIGDLLGALRDQGVESRTAIVLVADHGEGLGDHGEETHGVFLYQETVRVPLIVAAPGLAPARRTDPVSVVDVAPTLLGLAAVGGPTVSGVSLLHPAGDDRILYAATVHGWERYGWAPLQALRRGSTKAIDAPRREVYDLSADPTEQRPLKSSSSDALFLDVPSSTVVPPTTDPDPELRRQLLMLGYATSSPPDPDGAPDPKDGARWLPAMEQAGVALHDGRPADAERLLRPVAKADPGNPAALNDLGMALARLGRGAEAMEVLQRAVERTPADATVWTNLGYAAGVAGDLPTARAAYEEAAALAPSFAVPCLNRATLELRAGDRAAAQKWVDEALKRDPHLAEAIALRATLGAP